MIHVQQEEKICLNICVNTAKRVTIESSFEAEKLYIDGTRLRLWNCDILRDRMFVQEDNVFLSRITLLEDIIEQRQD